MTAAARFVRVAICPICGGDPLPLLSLKRQPIYQHPIPEGVEIEGLCAVDLSWVQCRNCAHAWQSEFDDELLSSIYQSHYYTPAPDGIAAQFRNDFLSALETFALMAPRNALLEIGASDGDVLFEMQKRTGAGTAHAFEPNEENAKIARARGLQVHEVFFGACVADMRLGKVDLVYARHVIEHIFSFDEFFAGIDAIASPRADLVFETPSLDYHGSAGSLAPFHIEHIHVFSLRSLSSLSRKFGWEMMQSVVSPDGNLIAAFRRDEARPSEQPEVARPCLTGLQSATDYHRARIQDLTDGRQLIFWGAGSAGVRLAFSLRREPEFWTDGNPNKYGKGFVGLKRRIVSPDEALVEPNWDVVPAPILIITSSFAREILPRILQIGWAHGIVDLNGNRLQ